MSTFRKPAGAALALIFCLASAGASAQQEAATSALETQRLYVSAQAGRIFSTEASAEIDFGGVTRPLGHSSDGGWNLGAAVGYQFSHFRIEAELQTFRFGADGGSVNGISTPVSGDYSYIAGFVNAYGLLWLNQNWKLFGGAGIGYADGSGPTVTLTRGCACVRDTSGSGLAWQLRAGIEYNVRDNDRLFLQYTYVSLPDTSSAGDFPRVSFSDIALNSISFGYRRMF